ncbi:MAG: L,D-transpeptidase family protein [Ornithinimicrobium sp.]|uniref:L,D-transpeptidase family protein n=1 Tax=Ornithinimicrobium sp. TaxID=1977084 RepID=UPI0026E10625|nr:L,D-transpeptidase family protein [Ornithinimicrobium sp.]MDO5740234.1 L,D-transpeptidase family protein [Ornithinimicrobium sp.]
MRLERFAPAAVAAHRALAGRMLPRRTIVRGGLGLVMGAVVGGLEDDLDAYTVKEPAPEPAPEPTPEPEPPVAAPEPPPPPTEFQRGDGGEGVWALQDKLNAQGYWCGAPDGGFGHLTQQAVYAVQKANGLYRDAIAGPMTLGALDRGLRPAPVAGGDHIEVLLGLQLLLVVRAGSTSMIFNTSTGNGEPYEYQGGDYVAHTPTGDFSVWYVDGSGWRDGELGELYRPMFYDGNFAIHGSASIPPWPASHGCARISTAAMDMFWASGLLAMGGRVIVA